MTDNTELKRLVDRVLTDRRFCGDENHKALADGVLALIAENERLAASVKLNLCDYPAIHRGDVDLLISFVSGTSQIELAELHQCTPPNISRKIRRVKERLGWKAAMGPLEICARADQLRALASQGAVVTADLMAERDQLKAENEALRKERDARHPFKPFHEPAIGYSDGCMVCGQWGGHFGLPCPKTRVTAQADLPETRSGQIGGAIGKGEQS
ncbi:hypothetical protein [Pseudomonas costantinii]|uniref:Uncharacterized protein n=1 Tax=Pseudomonas costantinii TaxID=168469 RepID=A0A1S2UE90_9PSED|nr:hypothetical protein [Pseudomonas costantinii]OIN44539.1 hypothetical protein BFL40_30085 [Pseudomonas costantinii]SED27176.1 hypothetical protein SAMN04515675_0511 [Pseudomonas costantinii]